MKGELGSLGLNRRRKKLSSLEGMLGRKVQSIKKD